MPACPLNEGLNPLALCRPKALLQRPDWLVRAALAGAFAIRPLFQANPDLSFKKLDGALVRRSDVAPEVTVILGPTDIIDVLAWNHTVVRVV